MPNTTPAVPVTSITFDNPDTFSLETLHSGRNRATVLPANASNKALTWTSSNPAVAEVSETGYVSALQAGTAVITARATDGSGVTGSYTLTVVIKVRFNSNGGGTPSSLESGVITGEAYGTLPTASRERCGFLGWFTAAKGGTNVTETTIVTQTEAHTLYAHWLAQAVTADPSSVVLFTAWPRGDTRYNTYPQSVTVNLLPSPADAERPPIALNGSSHTHTWISVETPQWVNSPAIRIYLNDNWWPYEGGAVIQYFLVRMCFEGGILLDIPGQIWGQRPSD